MSAKPGIGRIVHYTLGQGDVDTIDAQLPLYAGNRNAVRAGDVVAAVVVRVFDPASSTCNLQLLLDGSVTFWATSRVEGAEPGQWQWPVRV